jgi:hypothetical protein
MVFKSMALADFLNCIALLLGGAEVDDNYLRQRVVIVPY